MTAVAADPAAPLAMRRAGQVTEARPDTASPVALAVAAAIPGALLGRLVGGNAAVMVAVATAAAAYVATSAYAALSRRVPGLARPAAAAGAAALAALLGALAAAVAWPGPPGRSAPVSVFDAFGHGWAALATSAVPAPAEPRLTVPIVIVVWAAALGGIAVLRRTVSVAAALLPATAAFALACVAAGRHPWHPLACALAFVVAAAVVLARRDLDRRAAPAAAGVVVVVALAGAVAAPIVTLGRSPFDPREHLAVPLVPNAAESPLDLVAGWLQHDQAMFTVRAGEPLTTRLVALDAFDGVTWSVSGEWLPAGAVEADAAPGVPYRTVVAEISVATAAPLDPWLPAFGERPAVDGVDAIEHPPSGSLAVRSGTATGATYELTAELGEPDATALQVRAAAFDGEARRATLLPTDPPELLVEMAATATEGATTPFLKAFFLQRYLRGFGLDSDQRGGHSYGHLERALTVTGVGTSEQFATGFAVLGRLAGLPTRVVVGFGPGDTAADRTYTVTSDDVVVWPEVKFEGAGWVAFDPTPAEAGQGTDDSMQIGGQSVELVDPPDRPDPPATAEPPNTPGPTPGPTTADGSSLWRTAALATAGAALLLAAWAFAPALRKWRTTRRRRAEPDPQRRTLAAWDDVLDRLADTGEAGDARTVEEVVGAHTPELWGLYRPVTRALYADDAGPDAGPDDGPDDDAAWAARDRLVATLDARGGWLGRLRRATARP